MTVKVNIFVQSQFKCYPINFNRKQPKYYVQNEYELFFNLIDTS